MKNLSGQTLLGVIIGLAIMGILAQALFTLTNTSFKMVGFNRSRIAARHIAQDRIELIRNLPYDNIGTVGGIPSGPLEQIETHRINGVNYSVRTSVVYIDNSFDGTSPDDLLPTDFKRVRVDVSWEGITPSRNSPVVLVTDIAPQGIETTEGGGTLSILVFNSNGEAVPQADVYIRAETSPEVDLYLQTNDNGIIVLPGAPECTSCYTISATKEGYSTDRTYSTLEVANPNKPPISVIEGDTSEISLAIDLLSTVEVRSLDTRENEFIPIPNLTFTIAGAKTIGSDINDFPVFKYQAVFTTGTDGSLTIDNLEWDSYNLVFPSEYTLAGSNPVLPFQLAPGSIQALDFSLASSTTNSLLAIFTNGITPVASASVKLIKTPNFEETGFSGDEGDPDWGQIFFSNLESGTHTLEATLSGYLDFSSNISVSGKDYESVILNQ